MFVQAIETVDTKGNITRHAALMTTTPPTVRCGRGGTVDTNHSTPTIPSALKDVHCGRCRRLVEHDQRKLTRFTFKRKAPRIRL